MSKKEDTPAENEDNFDVLKENWIKRIDEVDAFSKRLSTAYSDVATEFLYGGLNLLQHYLDMQKSFSSQLPIIFYPDLIRNVAKQNTDVWIQAVQNVDSVCIDCLHNSKNNMRALNKSAILYLQNTQRLYDIYQNFQKNQPPSISEKESKTAELVVTKA